MVDQQLKLDILEGEEVTSYPFRLNSVQMVVWESEPRAFDLLCEGFSFSELLARRDAKSADFSIGGKYYAQFSKSYDSSGSYIIRKR